jgi:hypothetical protein
MANAARQEIDIIFDGKSYSVRPTFEVISAIEANTGQACAALAWKFLDDDPRNYASLSETGTVLYWALRPSMGDKLTPAKVGEVLMNDGCGPFWKPLGLLCSRAIKGNTEHVNAAMKEIEEAGATADSTPPVAADAPPQAS